MSESTCWECEGTGISLGQVCHECKGTGIDRERRLREILRNELHDEGGEA